MEKNGGSYDVEINRAGKGVRIRSYRTIRQRKQFQSEQYQSAVDLLGIYRRFFGLIDSCE
ncbi:MAG: hypothetical protein NC121_14090 [Blautia sp.]|nr:hypothetical protein [Blautia sp.]